MADANDMDLVREFARHNSEAAFAELVHRHINLVYSVAWRFTGNTGEGVPSTVVINSQQAHGQNSPVGQAVFWIKSDEFHDAFPVGLRRLADILFPLFDGGIGNAKIQELR
jgi:hypothetical protein